MKWQKRHTQSLTPTEYEQCLALMEADRRQKVLQIPQEERRKATVLGEWLAKTMLATQSSLPIEQIELLRTPKGKPYAKGLAEFSISHSGPWVVVALSHRPVGIDVECLRPIDLKLAQRVCTERDLAFLFTGEPLFEKTEDPALLACFFKIWTAKEAYFKQQGTGITNLKSVNYQDLAPLHFEEDGCIITII